MSRIWTWKQLVFCMWWVGVSCSDGNGGGPSGTPDDVQADLVVNDLVAADMAVGDDGFQEILGGDGAPADIAVTDTPTDLDLGPIDMSTDIPEPSDMVIPPDISPSDGGVQDMGTPPAGCCFTDADCDVFGSPLPHICAPTFDGNPGAWGVCKTVPPEGRCWGDAQCKDGQSCHAPNVCPCGAFCAVEDQMGVCKPKGIACAPIQSEWVTEICDAANVVIWDGKQCVATCPGCCGCQPFCDLTFSSIESCEKSCLADPCLYIGALADSPYGYTQSNGAPCPVAFSLASRCTTDADCEKEVPGSGKSCVYGNCVFCFADSQCEKGEVCRAGRCVSATPDCPTASPCTEPGCFAITPSESPCPVCVCDSFFNKACTEDEFCLMFSSVKYHGCIYGRCATCRNDADCPFGTCLPPGLCYKTTPDLHHLYGTWLIGWPGGLDHFSYFRFEPDGTLRRGHYEASGTFMDDIPPLPCASGETPLEYPLLGAWEPEVTESGFLVVKISLNVPCDNGAGYTARYNITLKETNQADFYNVDSGNTLMAAKVGLDPCSPDFSICEPPTFDMFSP